MWIIRVTGMLMMLGAATLAIPAAPAAAAPLVVIDGCTIKPRAVCPRTDFTFANLQGARLQFAKLQRSGFRGATVKGANLTGADLSGIGAGGTRTVDSLTGNTVLKGGSWVGVVAVRAKFIKAEFADGDLSGAKLSRADFTDAFFTRTKLARADMSFAILVRAELYGRPDAGPIPMQGLDLSSADLRFAVVGIDLTGVNLAGANLTDTDLSGSTNLDKANTTGAIFCRTDLPGFDSSPTIDTNC